MWLINSSIGRKVVMSVTGIALILFLTFHMSMNIVALFSEKAYNMICAFLGSNWYAVVATIALGALTVAHIVYAFILTAQNRSARGNERYAVNGSSPKVEWASKNMLVLGIIVLLGILLHLFNFWYWYHLSHGFWSAMQTLGINGKIWFKRWKMIGLVYTTLLMLGFLIVVLAFTFGCAPSLHSACCLIH